MPRLPRLLRSLLVVLTCLGIASVSLAASGGSKDPGRAVLEAAHAQLGDTYLWGGTGPKAWDCSGLTSVLWREVGGVKDIPRTSRQQQAWAVPLPVEQTQPGDLVFFGEPVTHVGIVENRARRGDGWLVIMVDASSSRHGVVRRAVWSSGVVRYGRVPRPGMLPVKPWTPPAPVVVPPVITPNFTTGITTSAVVAPTGKTPLAMPARQTAASSAVALRAARLAEAALGNDKLNDMQLVANVWRRAGGVPFPATRAGIAGATHRVSVAQARVGDFIVYAAPSAHVGIYIGGGKMISASRSLGEVVLREVWAGQGVQVHRVVR